MTTIFIPPALAAATQGRDLVTTAEFAKVTARASQTIRKNYCLQGECFGIRPVKIGNRLMWRVLHHARIVPIAGESYRLKHQRQAGMVQVRKGEVGG